MYTPKLDCKILRSFVPLLHARWHKTQSHVLQPDKTVTEATGKNATATGFPTTRLFETLLYYTEA
jgi:hypothetical protein